MVSRLRVGHSESIDRSTKTLLGLVLLKIRKKQVKLKKKTELIKISEPTHNQIR